MNSVLHRRCLTQQSHTAGSELPLFCLLPIHAHTDATVPARLRIHKVRAQKELLYKAVHGGDKCEGAMVEKPLSLKCSLVGMLYLQNMLHPLQDVAVAFLQLFRCSLSIKFYNKSLCCNETVYIYILGKLSEKAVKTVECRKGL